MASCPPPLVCSAGVTPASTSDWDWLSRLSNIGLDWYKTLEGPPQQRAAPSVNIPQASAKPGTSLGGFFSSTVGQVVILGGLALVLILVLRR